jgi:hypothetical protein
VAIAGGLGPPLSLSLHAARPLPCDGRHEGDEAEHGARATPILIVVARLQQIISRMVQDCQPGSVMRDGAKLKDSR